MAKAKAKAKEQPLCGAQKKASRGGGTCQVHAGRGTDHPGFGRCRHHGGCAPLKKGDKIALKTGRYETIFADVLEEDELDVMACTAAKSPVDLLIEEIGLLTVRERRMLGRIAALKAAGAMTVVEETIETMVPEAPGELPSERALSEMTAAEADAATRAEEPITKRKQKQAGTLGQIQAIESDLTAVQASKAKAIGKLHEMQNPGRKPGDPLDPDDQDEVPDGAADDRRAAALAALIDRARARPGGQAAGDPSQ